MKPPIDTAKRGREGAGQVTLLQIRDRFARVGVEAWIVQRCRGHCLAAQIRLRNGIVFELHGHKAPGELVIEALEHLEGIRDKARKDGVVPGHL